MPRDRELRTDGRDEKCVMFCTGNLKGRNIDPDVDGKDAETDIKNVHLMNGSVWGQATSLGKHLYVPCEGQIFEQLDD